MLVGYNKMLGVILRRKRCDDEENTSTSLLGRRRLRSLRDLSNPFQIDANVFIEKYRLSQDLALALIEEIKIYLPGTNKRFAIVPELKVLAALYFFAHGSNQKSIAYEHDIAMSQPSLSRCIQEVTEALNKIEILKKWIAFPNRQEIRRLVVRHYELFTIPGVLGFVDGTHVNIKGPIAHQAIYVNKKSQHSLNVQIACDSELRILNILAKYPGSCHDSFIWSNSALRRKMHDINENGEECWLLGDSDYPSEPWLITPVLYATEGSQEEIYTARHIKARHSIERCISVLKGRFRCLLKHKTLEYDPVKAGKIINACAVLHNICILGHLPIDIEDIQDVHHEEHLTSACTAPAELKKALQSFQDWKSGKMKKAAKVASTALATGYREGPHISGLSDVEGDFVNLIGEMCITGNDEVLDPLEGTSSDDLSPSKDPNPFENPEDSTALKSSEDPGLATTRQVRDRLIEAQKRERKRKRQEDFNDRMVAAIERQAEAQAKIFTQISRLADVGVKFYNSKFDCRY